MVCHDNKLFHCIRGSMRQVTCRPHIESSAFPSKHPRPLCIYPMNLWRYRLSLCLFDNLYLQIIISPPKKMDIQWARLRQLLIYLHSSVRLWIHSALKIHLKSFFGHTWCKNSSPNPFCVKVVIGIKMWTLRLRDDRTLSPCTGLLKRHSGVTGKKWSWLRDPF